MGVGLSPPRLPHPPSRVSTTPMLECKASNCSDEGDLGTVVTETTRNNGCSFTSPFLATDPSPHDARCRLSDEHATPLPPEDSHFFPPKRMLDCALVLVERQALSRSSVYCWRLRASGVSERIHHARRYLHSRLRASVDDMESERLAKESGRVSRKLPLR